MNKNNYVFLNIKKAVVLWRWKYKFSTEFLYVDFKSIAVHDSIARLDFYQLLRISLIFKTWVLRSISPFCSICQLFCHIFFTSLSVTPLLCIQPLNGIIIIISKNSTALLSINIVEVIDRWWSRWSRTLSYAEQLQLLKRLLLTVMSGTGVVVAAYI